MSWSRAQSQGRIEQFLRTVPEGEVSVRNFDEDFLRRRRADIDDRVSRGGQREQIISDLSRNAAVLVDGAHVYVQLLDFGSVMLEQQRETEASHRRALGMLHLQYAACDSIAEEFDAQRVDYHGPRMHAVILTPTGTQNSGARAKRALEFADAVKRTIEEVGGRTGDGQFRTRVRVGVDSGLAVAVNSGSRDEREPLFLGNPANYAAKLAEGDDEGIYPSNRVRREVGVAEVVSSMRVIDAERANRVNVSSFNMGLPGYIVLADRTSEEVVKRASDLAIAKFRAHVSDSASFIFHRHTPPLRDIIFADLMPSNTIRMELASVFGDIDGFTAYVAGCIQNQRISEMVANLHVIRSELAATLKHDFSGRKVRFIGDCIHGLLAEGTKSETDGPETVSAVVRAAAGMRSSFELCQQNLPNVDRLGLAIGVEFGTTPISRIGLRGDRSVRCSVSKAVTGSEALQAKCGGLETALGPRAMQHAPLALRRLFNAEGVSTGLDFDSLSAHLSSPIIVTSGSSSATAAPYLKDAD